ncbi:MAG: hypothetical protein H0X67_09955 [Acidobacteria bacterium]|nr:hypothetical protein [Acidobacteriota bacterium]
MRIPHGVVVLVAVGVSACAYPGMYGPRMAPPHQRAMMAPQAPASPVGRWDNVMMLEPGVPLRVLRMDGTRADGRFRSASPTVLRVSAVDTALEIAHADVARVDRLTHFGEDARAETARGAAVGLGTVGVLGLITGRMPPARHWGAGAIVGGYAAGQSQMMVAGPGTIYLAPAIAAPAAAGNRAPMP